MRSLRTQVTVVVAAVVLVYGWSATQNGFAFDDVRFVLENPRVLRPGGLAGWASLLWDPTATDPASPGGIVRPLRTLELALDHALFALSPTAFHLHSLAWHALASVLALLLLRTLCPGRTAGPLLGALLFAVHPVQVESVAWISSRGDVAMGACVLGALLLSTRPGRRALCVSLLLTFVGALYKETAVVTPLLVFAVRLVARPGGARQSLGRTLAGAWPWAVVACVYLLYRSLVQVGATDHTGGVFPGGGPAATFASMFTALGAYLGFLVAPVRPALDWYLPAAGGLGEPVPAAWLLVHVALVTVAVRLRHRAPLVSAGLCFVYFPLIPVANWPFPIGILTAERFLYVSVFGASLLVAAACRSPSRGRRRGTCAATALALVALATVSVVRTFDWHDTDTVMNAAAEHGGSPRALARRSALLRMRAMSEGEQAERRRLMEQALAAGHDSLAIWYDFEGGVAVANWPAVQAHVNAADLARRLGQTDEALWHATRAIAAAPDRVPQAHYSRALSLLRQGRGAAAHRAMRGAARAGWDEPDTELAEVYVAVARAALAEGTPSVALAALREARREDGTDRSPATARLASAAEAALSAARAAPDEPGSIVALAISTGTQDEWRAAADALEVAGTAPRLLAHARRESGDVNGAREVWARLASTGDSETADAVRAELARLDHRCPHAPPTAGANSAR